MSALAHDEVVTHEDLVAAFVAMHELAYWDDPATIREVDGQRSGETVRMPFLRPTWVADEFDKAWEIVFAVTETWHEDVHGSDLYRLQELCRARHHLLKIGDTDYLPFERALSDAFSVIGKVIKDEARQVSQG